YDADGNGEVGLADAVYVSQYLGGAFDPQNLDLCDVDRNGVVSEMDVRKIQYNCMGMLDKKGERVDDNANNANIVNSDATYRIYNAKTGDVLKEKYTLSKLASSNNARSVIGDEDRVIDWTKSGVVKLISSNYYLGTGFVVGDHVIATAAHCLYDYENTTPKPELLSEILLFDSKNNKTISVTPIESHIPVAFINAVDSKHRYVNKSDYALITVKEDLHAYKNFNLGVPLKSFDDSHSVVTVTGFPAKIGKPGEEKIVNNHYDHMMYSGNGPIYNGNDTLIQYTADMTPGNSGGPVYLTESYNGTTYYTVVGINVSNPSKDNVDYQKYNTGTRMTTDLIHFYNNNPNLKW
ncbi:MAG: trypsin-like peptidase domain-containing protein, partial [Ruminococcus sp.]|nr:trypsin-like peptidase domain-containing protein [Ruminococcus sp.]